MLSRVRKHLNPTTVVALLALVFAMTGGAFAMSGGGGSRPAGSTVALARAGSASAAVAKAKPKGKAGPRGPAGPKGASGAAGPAGATGPAGPAGPTGAAGPQGNPGGTGNTGETGKEGAPGKEGAGVTSKQLTTSEAACNKEGGSEFTTAGGKKTTACNGEKGAIHPGETLPVGATETGTWSIRTTDNAESEPKVAVVSFSIPLAKAPKFEKIALGEAAKGECKGTLEKPEANSGTLCIFEGESLVGKGSGLNLISPGHPAPEKEEASGPGTTGAELLFFTKAPVKAGEEVAAQGTFAVTG